jgi:thiol-disulfide isomerase/thioredoxin
VRRGWGLAVLVGVVAIVFGLDTGVLAWLAPVPTARVERFFIDKTGLSRVAQPRQVAGNDLPVEGLMPSLAGAIAWLNSEPLSPQQFLGQVVLVDFWTHSCINCLRSSPYIRAWNEKYKDYGLVVIGVHSPEFAFEKELGNVQRAVHDLGITYSVAVDGCPAFLYGRWLRIPVWNQSHRPFLARDWVAASAKSGWTGTCGFAVIARPSSFRRAFRGLQFSPPPVRLLAGVRTIQDCQYSLRPPDLKMDL